MPEMLNISNSGFRQIVYQNNRFANNGWMWNIKIEIEVCHLEESRSSMYRRSSSA